MPGSTGQAATPGLPHTRGAHFLQSAGHRGRQKDPRERRLPGALDPGTVPVREKADVLRVRRGLPDAQGDVARGPADAYRRGVDQAIVAGEVGALILVGVEGGDKAERAEKPAAHAERA